MTPEPAPVFLVASDVSPLAHLALIHAGRLARVRGGSVVAIHVVEQMVLDDLEEALPNARDVRTSVLAGARKRVEESVAQAIPPGVDVRVDIRIASPGAGILDAAREAGAALIVMGAHGGEGGGPPGSIARRVANKAACDVLLVRGTVAEPFRHVVSCLDFSDISRRALARAAEIARADAARLTALHVFVPPWKVLHYRAPTDEANPAFEAAFLRGLEDELGAAIDGLGDALKGGGGREAAGRVDGCERRDRGGDQRSRGGPCGGGGDGAVRAGGVPAGDDGGQDHSRLSEVRAGGALRPGRRTRGRG